MDLNRERAGIEQKFYELCLTTVAAEGLSLYAMEYIAGSSTLRIYIYNPETNTAILEECARVDRAFTPLAEELEWMPEKLMLEVSSPGIYRDLSSIEHFESAVGEIIKLSFMNKLELSDYPEMPKALKGNRKVIATLKSISKDAVVLHVDGFEMEVAFENIKKANLEPNI
ncbi:MAG: hypothetical protein KAG61_00800 [Bacteriovoracaceae bacterium]|nr:hypothetical protein [Bacteriovoracaceae bacterium]